SRALKAFSIISKSILLSSCFSMAVLLTKPHRCPVAQQYRHQDFRKSSGSLAMFAAIRRASIPAKGGTHRSRSLLNIPGRKPSAWGNDGGQYETPCSRISHFGAFSGCRIGPTGHPGVPPLRLRTLWLRLRLRLRLPSSLLPSSILRLPSSLPSLLKG